MLQQCPADKAAPAADWLVAVKALARRCIHDVLVQRLPRRDPMQAAMNLGTERWVAKAR